jgi:hypothetical protein
MKTCLCFCAEVNGREIPALRIISLNVIVLKEDSHLRILHVLMKAQKYLSGFDYNTKLIT